MKDLFERLVLGGAPAVRELIGRHETIDVDFKQRANFGNGNTKDDKKVLGKALSAFANSIGGLIVWGVDCRRNEEHIDVVCGFVPVRGLTKFASDMRDWCIDALMPRLSEVDIFPIFEGDDCGYLLVRVSRSERRPHHCEFGERGYYRRAGATSRKMEHFEIEDAFRRISAPELDLSIEIEGHSSRQEGQSAVVKIGLMIYLRNNSNISASHAYVRTDAVRSPIARNGIRSRRQDIYWYHELESDLLIHPGNSRLVGAVELSLRMQHNGSIWMVPAAQVPKKLDVDYGCLNSSIKSKSVTIDKDIVLSKSHRQPVKYC